MEPTKEMIEGWTRSAREQAPKGAEVEYKGPHPNGFTVTATINKGHKVRGELHSVLGDGPTEGGPWSHNCTCFTVHDGTHTTTLCLLCQNYPPFRCQSSPTCSS